MQRIHNKRHMVADPRNESLRIRMSAREKAMMQELADIEGLTASEYIRHFVRREHLARFGASKRKKARRG